MTSTRRESRNIAGRFRGGKLAPVMATAFKAGEGGMLSQTASFELDPVAGRLISPVTCEVFAVYVPVQAMTALRSPNEPGAGITEVIRQQLLGGAILFALENEDEVSKRCGVMPRSIGGVPKVSEAVRLAHNCAVNYLRKRKYTYAVQRVAADRGVTPALLSTTALELFNGVLNPDDHINGAVALDLSSDYAPVRGIARSGGAETGPTAAQLFADADRIGVTGGGQGFTLDLPNSSVVNIWADVGAISAGGVSLTDFYNAERMDKFTRQMRAIIDANPVDGEEQVLRWAYGLEVDTDANPFLLYSGQAVFGQEYKEATDAAGMQTEVAQSRMMQRMSFSVPVPKTELGGVVITFMTVKPDEVVYQQPHPFLADSWYQDNVVADELLLDPVPVIARDLAADVPSADESTVVFYTGLNELKRLHVNYGFNRHLDPTTVEAKTALWQYEVPASVTPENIIYPADISHYPFLDETAEVCTYMLRSEAIVQTPIVFGPSPVETVAIIESEDIFNEDEGA